MFKKVILLFGIIFFISGGLIALWAINLDIPDFESFNERLVTQSTKIYDRTGEVLLYTIHDEVKRQVVPAEEISRHIKNAMVAIEDSEFYEHAGVKPLAMLRAFLVNLSSGGIKQGGSTITQQLIKNSLLTNEKKISRKIKELVLALKIEKVMTKEEILTLYLNESPFGGSMYGVEEAAFSFFNKHAKDVTLAEAAYLAAIPKAPTYYSPYGNHRAELDRRRELVLTRLADLGFISRAESDAAIKEIVVFEPVNTGNIRAPHFVLWVREYLEDTYGKELLINKGLKVITTLDWVLQEKAEAIVKQYATENKKNFNASNAGLVAIDPKTGQILVMVGSKDYFDVLNEGNFNITLAHRQPGSAFKPIVYAAAFNQGYTPETVVFDLPTQFDTTCASNSSACYTPINYDNKFRGPISLRAALAQSINIPAIKVLYLTGISQAIVQARDLGISSLSTSNQYGLTLVLGGGEVSLLELTGAYSVFANDGERHTPTPILKIDDLAGNNLETYETKAGKRVLPEQTARLISSILSDNNARAPTFGLNSPLNFTARPVAVKTGTTNDYRDAWILGYTPNITVGAWAGNNDNTPMDKKVAGFIIAPMWRAFMEGVFQGLPIEHFIPPEPTPTNLRPPLRGLWNGGQSYVVDKISGKLATEFTPLELREERVIKQTHSILYWLDKDNPRGEAPVNPKSDPQFSLWEEPIRRWARGQGLVDETLAGLPTATDDIHRPEYQPVVRIISPTTGTTHTTGQALTVQIEAIGRFPSTQADFFLNNLYLGSSMVAPFSFTFSPEVIEPLSENNKLKVAVYDTMRNKGEASVTIHLTSTI